MSELTLEHLRRRKDEAKEAFEDAKAAVYYTAAVLGDDEQIGRLRSLIEQAEAAGKRWYEANDAFIAFIEAEHASDAARKRWLEAPDAYIALLDAEHASQAVEDAS